MTGRHRLGSIGLRADVLHEIEVLDHEMADVADKLAQQEADLALDEFMSDRHNDEERAPRRVAGGA